MATKRGLKGNRLKEKRIQELIFLANTVLDVGFPSAEFAWTGLPGSPTSRSDWIFALSDRVYMNSSCGTKPHTVTFRREAIVPETLNASLLCRDSG